jgi:hypothetical protein
MSASSAAAATEETTMVVETEVKQRALVPQPNMRSLMESAAASSSLHKTPQLQTYEIIDMCDRISRESMDPPRRTQEEMVQWREELAILTHWFDRNFLKLHCEHTRVLGAPHISMPEAVWMARATLLWKIDGSRTNTSANPPTAEHICALMHKNLLPDRAFVLANKTRGAQIETFEVTAYRSIRNIPLSIDLIASFTHAFYWQRFMTTVTPYDFQPITCYTNDEKMKQHVENVRAFLCGIADDDPDSTIVSKGRKAYRFAQGGIGANTWFKRRNILGRAMFTPDDVLNESFSKEQIGLIEEQNKIPIRAVDDAKVGENGLKMNWRRRGIWFVFLFTCWFDAYNDTTFIADYVVFWQDWPTDKTRMLFETSRHLRPRLPLILDLGFSFGIHDSRSNVIHTHKDMCVILVHWFKLAVECFEGNMENGQSLPSLFDAAQPSVSRPLNVAAISAVPAPLAAIMAPEEDSDKMTD